jgi:lysophospholipase L1-like esterase
MNSGGGRCGLRRQVCSGLTALVLLSSLAACGSALHGDSGGRDASTAPDSGRMDAATVAGRDGSGVRDAGLLDPQRGDAELPGLKDEDAAAGGDHQDASEPDTGSPPPPTCDGMGATSPAIPTIFVIGDSTASSYTSDRAPRTGWGQLLGESFRPACATVQNRAIAGRSSKSFFDEGAWTPIKDALRPGDFVLIQFGHNDEKANVDLHTDPFTSYRQYLSVYIDDALAAAAVPVLLTSIQRNYWAGAALDDTHGDYPVAMRQLAQERDVSLIDLTVLTTHHFERVGRAATTELFMVLAPGDSPNYPDGITDNTHLQEGGARIIVQLLLADAWRQRLALASLLSDPPSQP